MEPPMKLNRLIHNPLTLACTFMLLISANNCSPFNNLFLQKEKAQHWEAKIKTDAPTPTNGLKIMDWNIKFGAARADFFFDCHGDTQKIGATEVKNNLQAISDKINNENPDII